ncbi:putative aspartyl/asparaginyl beta-hydroxylase (Aspartate beta-hydroxylase) (Peptide-aspartate beta-dioxygenase) [Desulfamplus magnetovallimortis]|uniref:Putative aspartyl/asparaginyl beta-hydroxylase (Aspartate beta-hydroxylase) (Peptide-aspartate beta-dioxygenase) n=1 Tax=Desulfamplus magnetovallimortis TaxID=1246637 RepID=A0A1W1HKK0_9BACT|nr:putative aspartyl/asparaginyl beta-hydroxylase (Aspartate beta-hydroxylase) (Peptide-aspartate beta-dioxygenase) [Desulfamplus magnetovallimortis]
MLVAGRLISRKTSCNRNSGRMYRFWLSAFLSAFCLQCLLTGCVETQEFVLLENRVATLEAVNRRLKEKTEEYDSRLKVDFVNLEEGVAGVQKNQQQKYADINATIESIKNDIRLLKGEIEESEYRLAKGGAALPASDFDRLDSAVSNNYKRIARLEKHLGLSPPEDVAGLETEASSTSTNGSGMDEEKLYMTAKSLLDQGANEDARKQFELFIEKFPKSSNADNARFWIADSYYRDKWYEKAILEYQRVIEEYPRGNKVPAALLKQGYSFATLGERKSARLILEDVINKYPQSQEAALAKEKLKSL